MQSMLDSPCRSALKGLAEGRLAAWNGLDGCTAADAEATLGNSTAGPALADAWGKPRYHPGGPGTPHGVQMWLHDDRIYALKVVSPRLDQPFVAVLGEPESKLDSALSSDWQQWVYCSRGLTLHVTWGGGDVHVLYGYTPMSVSDFARSEIARVRNREYPLELP